MTQNMWKTREKKKPPLPSSDVFPPPAAFYEPTLRPARPAAAPPGLASLHQNLVMGDGSKGQIWKVKFESFLRI